MLIKVSEDLKNILPKYIENRKKEVGELKSFLEQKDFSSLITRGHRLAGNAPSYGLDFLGEMGIKIEAEAKAQKLENIPQYISQIEKYLGDLEVEFIEEDDEWE